MILPLTDTCTKNVGKSSHSDGTTGGLRKRM